MIADRRVRSGSWVKLPGAFLLDTGPEPRTTLIREHVPDPVGEAQGGDREGSCAERLGRAVGPRVS